MSALKTAERELVLWEPFSADSEYFEKVAIERDTSTRVALENVVECIRASRGRSVSGESAGSHLDPFLPFLHYTYFAT